MTRFVEELRCELPRKPKIFLMAAAASISFPCIAQAQAVDRQPEPTENAAATGVSAPSAGGHLEEIVVTAQRRSERLQNVPVTVSVIGASKLASLGINQLTDLDVAVPGLDIQNNDGSASPFLRGVGSSALGPGIESPVAIYVDGVYYGASPGSLLSLNNISQIDVLKGPQGTLFGRNATGGLVQVTTKTPQDHFAGNAEFSYGNYDSLTGNLYVTGPIATNLTADLAVRYAHQGDGYGVNEVTGQDVLKTGKDYSFRSKLRFTPSSRTTATLTADYGYIDSSMLALRLIPGTTAAPGTGPAYGGSPWDYEGTQPYLRVKSGGVSLKVDQELGFGTIESISAYRRVIQNKLLDLDATATDTGSGVVREDDRQFSQEIHLISTQNELFNWQAGIYYYYADGRYAPVQLILNPGPTVILLRSKQITNSAAGFAQATLKILPRTNLTFGGRYTYEKRNFDSSEALDLGSSELPLLAVSAKKSFSKPTFRVSLDHHLTNGVMLFASFNTGFKSGGFQPSIPTAPPFRPETLNAVEAGLKGDFFSRTIRFNASFFYYDYKGIQVNKLVEAAVSIVNGSGAHVYGLDVDTEIHASNRLTLTGSAEYLHARYTSFLDAPIGGSPSGGAGIVPGDASGNRLPYSPTFSFNASANYKVNIASISSNFNVSYAHNSGYNAEPDNFIMQKAYGLLSASAKFDFQSGFEVTLWGKNLINEAVQGTALTFDSGNQIANYKPPRTYGATIAYRF